MWRKHERVVLQIIICVHIMLCGYFTVHLHTGCITCLVFSSIWPGVQKWSTSFKLSCLFLRKLCMQPFMCTIKCRAINALQEKLSRSVCHYPHLSRLSYLPCLCDGRDFYFQVCMLFSTAHFSHFLRPDGKLVLHWEAQKKQEKMQQNKNIIIRKNTTKQSLKCSI